MSRILTITMEVNDTEFASLLDRFKERGAVEIADTSPEGPKPTGETDARGVIWDARFHASTKNTNQDGSWKARRNMTAEEKSDAAAYESAFTNPAPAAAEPEPVTDDSQIPAFLQKPAAAAPVVPSAPTPPAAPAAPVVAPTPAPVTYDALIAKFTAVQADPKVGSEKLMANLARIYEAAGCSADGSSLQTNETQRAVVMAELEKL